MFVVALSSPSSPLKFSLEVGRTGDLFVFVINPWRVDALVQITRNRFQSRTVSTIDFGKTLQPNISFCLALFLSTEVSSGSFAFPLHKRIWSELFRPSYKDNTHQDEWHLLATKSNGLLTETRKFVFQTHCRQKGNSNRVDRLVSALFQSLFGSISLWKPKAKGC